MCTKFIGREKELKVLEGAYSKDEFQMCVVYGRRRIGKTRLINEFLKEKEHISFTAIKGSYERNLELFSNSVLQYFMPEMSGVTVNSVDKVLDIISKNVGSKKLIIFIDDLPYFSEVDTSFLSILQREIDTCWQNKNIFLILSGSAISFMEQEVLSSKSPLFGRRTMQINLLPFDYLDTARFVPEYSFEEKAICYGLTGGVAKYISMFNPKKSLDDNIVDLFFTPSGFLYEEPNYLLTQEYKNVRVYADIISAIANGSVKASEIKDKTHLENASIHNVLNKLMETRIVRKELAITEENNKKKVRYILADGMFLFWHKFIPQAIPTIEIDHGKDYYLSHVKPKLHEFMGEIFEEMCRHYLLLHGFDENMPCNILQIGKWTGSNPAKKEPTDIDVVGLDTVNNKAILGECKFRNTPIDKSVYESLRERSGLIDPKYVTVAYFLFSLSGFTEWFKENKDDSIRMIGIEDLYL